MWQTLGKGEVWRGSLVNHRKDGSEYVADILISPAPWEWTERIRIKVNVKSQLMNFMFVWY